MQGQGSGLRKQNSFMSRIKFDADGGGVSSSMSEKPPYVEWSIATVVKKSEDFHIVHPIVEVPIQVNMSEYAYRKLMALEQTKGGWTSPGSSMHGGNAYNPNGSNSDGSAHNKRDALDLIEAIRQEASHHGGSNYSEALEGSIKGGLGKAMDELMKSEKDVMMEKTRTVTSRFGLYCVFDGHNGPQCGHYLRDNIASNLQKHMKIHQESQERPEDAIIFALRDTFVDLSDTFKNTNMKGSGSTATVCHLENRTLTIASVGDSRAALDTGNEVVMISTDHRVEDNADECARIRSLGGVLGRVRGPDGQSVGPLRVWPGGLAMSRSIGDADVGISIISEPDVIQVEVPMEGARVIIASDGLWDTCGAEQAARMVRMHAPKIAAEKLTQGALRSLGLRDDITVVVLDIIPSKDEPFARAKAGGGGCGCFGGPKEPPRPFVKAPAVHLVSTPKKLTEEEVAAIRAKAGVPKEEAAPEIGSLAPGELDDGSAHFSVAKRAEDGTAEENKGLNVDLEEVGEFQTRRTSGAKAKLKEGQQVALKGNVTNIGQLPGDAGYGK